MSEISKEVDNLQIIEEESNILGVQIFARQLRNNEGVEEPSPQVPARSPPILHTQCKLGCSGEHSKTFFLEQVFL